VVLLEQRNEDVAAASQTLALRNESFAHRVENQFREIMKIEFLLKISTVCFDRVWTEIQQRSDLLILLSFRE
jgi:hypothetical protein